MDDVEVTALRERAKRLGFRLVPADCVKTIEVYETIDAELIGPLASAASSAERAIACIGMGIAEKLIEHGKFLIRHVTRGDMPDATVLHARLDVIAPAAAPE